MKTFLPIRVARFIEGRPPLREGETMRKILLAFVTLLVLAGGFAAVAVATQPAAVAEPGGS